MCKTYFIMQHKRNISFFGILVGVGVTDKWLDLWLASDWTSDWTSIDWFGNKWMCFLALDLSAWLILILVHKQGKQYIQSCYTKETYLFWNSFERGGYRLLTGLVFDWELPGWAKCICFRVIICLHTWN